MKKYLWSLSQLLLGIALGALLVLSVMHYRNERHLIRTQNKDWSKLVLIMNLIQENYVDTVDKEQLQSDAAMAALQQLDPHSLYLPPVQLEASEQELAGNFDGIGIQFNVPSDTAIVLEVISGGPSEKAGLLPGDRLLKVDDKVIAGVHFPQDSMVRRMKGPSGTEVTVTVGRGKEQIPFRIVRGKIPVHSVDAAFMLSDSVGYLRLSKFSRTTFKECREATLALQEEGMRHLVFDLRDNTGGYMDQALLLSNDYLAAGDTIVYMEGVHRPREVFKADGRGKFQEVGLTLLISEGSASASEIFAGAIQDNDRGMVIGRRSFGKGLVQEPFFFSDDSGIRLTVARYYTPSGRCIQKPYDSYSHDLYDRYRDGEVFSADSVKLDTADIHYTRSGRRVYGGGGIMPDVFVPMDTTRATPFYVSCNRKASQMRFAAYIMDRHQEELRRIDNFPAMDRYLAGAGLARQFRSWVERVDGLRCSNQEWAETLPYLEPQLQALVARYSKLGERGFYKYYLPVDSTLKEALERRN